MRIKGDKQDISYKKTKVFFDHRIQRYNEDNPYSVTMYQDKHPELIKSRNEKEISKLLPKLELDQNSKVLDVACGIGRWSDAIDCEIKYYCGVDFCDGFIELAKQRNKHNANRFFYTCRSTEIENTLRKENRHDFNRILFVGSLMYLNDIDVFETLTQVERLCAKESIIVIREPIGIDTRLTLEEQYSDELEDEYNAIYRTRNELVDLMRESLLAKGFRIIEEDDMFIEKGLNNRKETKQYYYVLKRE